MIKKIKKYDAVIMPAALSDFIPTNTKGKLDSSKAISLKMKKAPKIISSIRKKHKGLLYAFKLSAGITYKKLIQKAESLLKDADCVIANHSDAMGAKKSKIAVVGKKNVEWLEGSKNILSR